MVRDICRHACSMEACAPVLCRCRCFGPGMDAAEGAVISQVHGSGIYLTTFVL